MMGTGGWSRDLRLDLFLGRGVSQLKDGEEKVFQGKRTGKAVVPVVAGGGIATKR